MDKLIEEMKFRARKAGDRRPVNILEPPVRQMRVLIALVAILFAAPAHAAVNRAATERAFQAWLTEEIWPEAQAAGVSRKTFDAALDGVTLDWDLPELAPPGAPPPPHTTEVQAEFRSPGAYFDQKNLNAQAATGRAAHRQI